MAVWANDSVVKQLKDCGPDAIEYYYPKYTLEQQAYYLCLTEMYRLHQTGCSDFHGGTGQAGSRIGEVDIEF